MKDRRFSGFKRGLSILLVSLLLCTLCACGINPGSGGTSGATQSFTDDLGRRVTLPKTLTRVATLGTTGQCMLLSLAPELLVGINAGIEVDARDYMDFDYAGLPVMGQYYGQRNLNLEEVAGSGAEVIIDLGDTKTDAASDMDKIQAQSGIPTIHINSTLETAPMAFRTLGQLLGRADRGEELAVYCEKTNGEVNRILAAIPQDKRARVLLCSGPDGTTVTVKGRSHSQILDMVATNVADVTGNSGTVDVEEIHRWNPDVILFLKDSLYSEVGTLPQWQDLSAIGSGRYYETPVGPYCWVGYPPTVNRYLGLLWLTAILYPEQCPYNLEEKVSEYYQVFYGTGLPHSQYQKLTRNAIK
ncbi:ABC transporter substrate-binding protein [Eubacterium barkeri]|uniref:Iron complex transport system substrate-binding protein n=1 Tax=Eubacterium barkeri TaxID=1528 RepID=A0A1H3FP78_EUBBA|nr:ABC transporter substrate-binding protein [Eubacterium barkeri]SDX92607.1 iron complex transport system substrate-binding protein [Eubacterium barkeri]